MFVLTTPRSAAEVRSLLGGFAVEGVELAALPASEGDLVFAVRVPPPPPAPGAIPSVPDAMTDALGEERAMPIPAVPLPRPPPGGLERSGVD